MKNEDALERDRAGIIAVIEEESAAWLRGDLDAWASCWLQDERAQHVTARPSVGGRVLRGFPAILDYMTPYFRGMLAIGVQPQDIAREKWCISVGDGMAWATFDQLIPLKATSDGAPGRHNQMRVLEQVDGVWKIAALFQIPNRIGYYGCPWVRVDARGEILEASANAVSALKVHGSLKSVAGRLSGRTGPARDKLKKALIDAHKMIERQMARPPVALVLNDADTDSISLSWVTTADLMIVILLGDDGLLSDRIASAGESYRLTRAQMRVAEAVARGSDLSQTAAMLGVKTSTVRTHVRRMFEKVSVKSQPALMRALLSVEAPRP